MAEANAVNVDKETAKYLFERGMERGQENSDHQKSFNLNIVNKNPQSGVATCVVRKGDVFEDLMIFEPRDAHKHKLLTIESLVKYLSGDDLKDKDIRVFTSTKNVTAIIGYGEFRPDVVEMPVAQTIELRGLMLLEKGVGQKELFKLLRGPMAGCFSTGLLMQISNMKFTRTFDASTDITNLGIASEKKSDVMKLAWNTPQGSQEVEIGTEWEWSGRLWDCYDEEFAINCALGLDVDGNRVVFTMTPQRLDQVVRDSIEKLVAKLDAETPDNVRIYSGEPNMS